MEIARLDGGSCVRRTLASSVLILAAACSHTVGSGTDVVAVVGGKPVTTAVFEFYVKSKTGIDSARVDSRQKVALLDEMLRLEAAAAIASQASSPDAVQEAEIARVESLARSAARAAGVYATPSDEVLAGAYQSYVAALPSAEYHIAHILVPTRNAARDIVERLDRGENFGALARENSADESRLRSGDLGWVKADGVPSALIGAARTLKLNQYARQPIKTAYGWHVVRLIESRPVTPPSFEQVKAQLAVTLQQERWRKFLDESLQQIAITRNSQLSSTTRTIS